MAKGLGARFPELKSLNKTQAPAKDREGRLSGVHTHGRSGNDATVAWTVVDRLDTTPKRKGTVPFENFGRRTMQWFKYIQGNEPWFPSFDSKVAPPWPPLGGGCRRLEEEGEAHV
jgi:hypothetical protein